jgi:hypothetical protein
MGCQTPEGEEEFKKRLVHMNWGPDLVSCCNLSLIIYDVLFAIITWELLANNVLLSFLKHADKIKAVYIHSQTELKKNYKL